MARLPLGLALAALSVIATAADAAPKHQARHARVPPAVERASPPRPAAEPPRMIEARPGVFVSSWGCITDEGYGRWTVCGQGRGE
jgi:hypothetical protein